MMMNDSFLVIFQVTVALSVTVDSTNWADVIQIVTCTVFKVTSSLLFNGDNSLEKPSQDVFTVKKQNVIIHN